ncbi:hypothetical protein ACRRVB_00915 [Candidatus Cardinium hertigii]|uniref:hypothetical protein n=1 Tax=Candidatus Cardinium hertigii TaxID=247481 RepID=UPI003D7DC8D5
MNFLKIKKNICEFFIFFLVVYVFLLGCSHKIKYGVISRAGVEPDKTSLNNSFAHTPAFRYSNMIPKSLWNNAYKYGFIKDYKASGLESPEHFYANANISMESSLGEIFFQTLRWHITHSDEMNIQSDILTCTENCKFEINKLNIEKEKKLTKKREEVIQKNIDALNTEISKIDGKISGLKRQCKQDCKTILARLNEQELMPWKNIGGNDESCKDKSSREKFICPRPWKYVVKTINGCKCGVFELENIQTGEYFKVPDQPKKLTNYDIVNISKRRKSAPYIMVHHIKNVNKSGTQEAMKVEVDHLMRDNRYIIELPSQIHKIKTMYLDPFIRTVSFTDRNIINSDSYWRSRDEFSKNQKTLDCKCGSQDSFKPRSTHEHKGNYAKNYEAKMLLQNTKFYEDPED